MHNVSTSMSSIVSMPADKIVVKKVVSISSEVLYKKLKVMRQYYQQIHVETKTRLLKLEVCLSKGHRQAQLLQM